MPPRARGRLLPGLRGGLILLILAGLSVGAGAQTAPSPQPPPVQPTQPGADRPNVESITERRAELEADQAIDADLKQRAIKAYDQALAHAKSAAEWSASAQADRQAAQQAPERLAEIRRTLQAEPNEPNVAAPLEASAEQLEQDLAAAEAELEQIKAQVTRLADEVKRRATVRRETPPAVAAAQQRLTEARNQLTGLEAADTPEPLKQAIAVSLQAEINAAQAEMTAAQQRLTRFDAERELLQAQRDLALRRQGEQEEIVEAWRKLVASRRAAEARQAAEQARRDVTRATPAVRELAEQNRLLAQSAQDLAERIRQAGELTTSLTERHEQLAERLLDVRRQAQLVGMTTAIGARLRQVRGELPDVDFHVRRVDQREDRLADIQLAQIRLQTERDQLIQNGPLEQFMASLPSGLAPPQRDEIRREASNLLTRRSEILDKLISDHGALLARLVEADAAERELIRLTREWSEYIGENVLWIRSTGVIGPGDVVQTGHTVLWLTRPDAWKAIGRALLIDALTNPVSVALAVLVVGLLLVVRGRARRRLAVIGGDVLAHRNVRIYQSVEALALTVVLAAGPPAVLWAIGWRMQSAVEMPPLGRALARGVVTAGWLLAMACLLRAICWPQGLAGAHFGWPGDRLAAVRRTLNWLMIAAIGPAGLVVALEYQPAEVHRSSLGRVALVVVLVTFAAAFVSLSRALRRRQTAPGRPVPRTTRRHRRWAWRVLAAGVPIALATAALAGYYYTAVQLTWRVLATLILALGLLGVRAMVLRWLMLSYRRLALKRMEQTSQAQQTATTGEGETVSVSAPGADLTQVTNQSRQFLSVLLVLIAAGGLFVIWEEALPSLGILGRYELWSTTRSVSEEVPTAEGGLETRTVERAVPVTLADLALAVAVVVPVMILAGKNLPGLLEILLLQRIPLDAGVRYAVTTIVRYVIFIVGAVLAFGMVGIGWSSVQWLVAAMTVGLGFGLQEIFANFVSGLIILFERPIRIGDTVTVGEVTGTVSRIQIRATTITDWSRKELIVPNREFITGRLVNWSLSDRVLRVVVPVGIAYGSDTAKAEQILRQIASGHPLVLSDPAPVILFNGFGDSALNFEVRVYITGIEHWLRIIHEMHMAIDQAFRDARITIAFPQRDVHLDTESPLEVRLLRQAARSVEPQRSEQPPPQHD